MIGKISIEYVRSRQSVIDLTVFKTGKKVGFEIRFGLQPLQESLGRIESGTYTNGLVDKLNFRTGVWTAQLRNHAVNAGDSGHNSRLIRPWKRTAAQTFFEIRVARDDLF